jgi:biopolymer transport protein ExbD
MRIRKKNDELQEGDLTPMIDMTFQLIAFFMVLVNFSDAEQDQRIHLPSSELAKPPDAAFEEPRYVQLTKDGAVLFTGDEVPIAGLKALMLREAQIIAQAEDKSASEVTIIIRADGDADTGEVQEIIQICQETGFERFALRAKQEEEGT